MFYHNAFIYLISTFIGVGTVGALGAIAPPIFSEELAIFPCADIIASFPSKRLPVLPVPLPLPCACAYIPASSAPPLQIIFLHLWLSMCHCFQPNYHWRLQFFLLSPWITFLKNGWPSIISFTVGTYVLMRQLQGEMSTYWGEPEQASPRAVQRVHCQDMPRMPVPASTLSSAFTRLLCSPVY